MSVYFPTGVHNKEKRLSRHSERASQYSHGVQHDTELMADMANSTKPIFADAEAMKEKLRQNMQRPPYDVSNYYHETGLFQHLAKHTIFERVTLFVIALNALYISIDTDNNKALSLLDAMWPFQMMEHFFCFYFSLEWFVRFMAFKRKRDGCKDAWFVFDTIMVVMMIFETWVMTFMFVFAGGQGGSGGLGNASIMRLLRLLRLSRMARMARLLRAMPELLILIKGMVSAMRSVFFTLLLQLIILYIFGITFRQLTDGLGVGLERFSDVPASMHTLLLCGTLMDNIGDLVQDLGSEGFIYPFVFYIFVLISALTVMNMLIGVLCEVVSAVAATEKEELTVAYVQARLREILRQGGLDQDGDGMISQVEFAQILDNPAAARILSEVGVDVFGLVELSDFIFETEDDTGAKVPDAQLTFGRFMEIILQLRGSNTATVKDIVDLRKFLSASMRSVENKLTTLENKFMAAMKNLGIAPEKGFTVIDTSSKLLGSEPKFGSDLSLKSSTASKSLALRKTAKLKMLKSTEDVQDDAAFPSCPSSPKLEIQTSFERYPSTGSQEVLDTSRLSESDPIKHPSSESPEDLPLVPNETEVVCEPLNCAGLEGTKAVYVYDQFREGSPRGFERVRLELERLRQHVDAELVLIAQDISRKAENLAVVPPTLNRDPGIICNRIGFFEEFSDCPKLMPSSALVTMSPGAEMTTHEFLTKAGTALAWRSLSAEAQDALTSSLARDGVLNFEQQALKAAVPSSNRLVDTPVRHQMDAPVAQGANSQCL